MASPLPTARLVAFAATGRVEPNRPSRTGSEISSHRPFASDEARYITGTQLRVDGGGYLKWYDYHI
jgi:NAD(P)-dependent dehydrogenase (short-subunit alcohol dehydrogenase family)